MTASQRVGMTALALLLVAGPVGAQRLEPVEVARRGKAAAVVVESPSGRSRGPGGFDRGGRGGGVPDRGGRGSPFTTLYSSVSAFCVHPAGLFLTSTRAVSGGVGGTVRVVCRPGLKEERRVEARVLRVDTDAGLALLWVPESPDIPALPLGSRDDLRERAEVIVCGFTGGRSRRGGTAAELRLRPARVLGLTKAEGRPETVRLSADPGTGGAVLDRKGQLVGWLVGGEEGTGQAIPADRLREFLRAPVVQLAFPDLTPANRHESLAFTARVFSPLAPADRAELRLELEVRAGEGEVRKVPMAGKAGMYQAAVVPVPAPARPPRHRVTLTYPDGKVEGLAEDQEIKLGGKAHPLRSIVSIRPLGEHTFFLLEEGGVVEGDTAALPALEVALGGKAWKLPLSKASEVRIEPPEEVTEVSFAVVGREGEKEVLRWAQTARIAPEAGAVRRVRATDLDRSLGSAVQLFERYAEGKAELVLADLFDAGDPLLARRLEDYAQREGITNGRLTRAQFVRYQMEVDRTRGPSRRGFDRGGTDRGSRSGDRGGFGRGRPFPP